MLHLRTTYKTSGMPIFRWNRGILPVCAILLLQAWLVGLASPSVAEPTRWLYGQGADPLTGKPYSHTTGFIFDYKYSYTFLVAFQCIEKEIQFYINADTFITSKGEEFSFFYRVDAQERRQLSMRTFSNSNQSGYTLDNVEQIAKDMLGGRSMFVRAVTWDNDYLETRVYMDGANYKIRKVFYDCGISLDPIAPDQQHELPEEVETGYKESALQQELPEELPEEVETGYKSPY